MNSFGIGLLVSMLIFLVFITIPLSFLFCIAYTYKDFIKSKCESGNKITKISYKEILNMLYQLPEYYYDCNRECIIYTNIKKVGRQEFDIMMLGIKEVIFISFKYSDNSNNTLMQHCCYIDSDIISLLLLRYLYYNQKKILLRHNYISKEDIKVIDYELSTPIKIRRDTNINLEPYLNISPVSADVFKETLKMF